LNTHFNGENLVPGQLGHFFVILAFVASILAGVSYFLAVQSKDEANKQSWKKLGRLGFTVQALAVFGIFSTLFYIISNHLFEYNYAWQHSSRDLPGKYLLSCFWEGQEGSFLLWSFWHSVLGLILIRTTGKFEAPVMAVVSLAQFCLGSMLLGVYVFGYKVGSTPFILLRDQMVGAPIFSNPDYLKEIKDGNGLNPLLQNYWMVIHPPILFLGFASTIVPFAYAIAGMWTNNYKDWVKPALTWGLFSAMILGLGIMMGAAWAYESLTFGGYWAWDPVENASLVPWLTLVAGLHTLLVYKHSGHSLRATIVFFILTFVLVLYSTFLTRSGVLGETSVHSFTDLGMSGQLLVYLFAFLVPSFVLLFVRYKQIPDIKKEESISSREFWMFIGALVMTISAVHITFFTSSPVWNKLFKLNLAPPTDPVAFYNKVQLWIAVILGILTAVVQYFKYKETSSSFFWKKMTLPLVISVVVTLLAAYFQNIWTPAYFILLLASVYATIANAMYIFSGNKGNLIQAGGSITHLGFGLMLVGILISSYNKKVVSLNRLGVDLNMGKETKEENIRESRQNILLFLNVPVGMSDYQITYIGDSVEKPNHYYKIQYLKKDSVTGAVQEEFVLKPNAQFNEKMGGLISNPDTRHYWNKDIFTFITKAIDKSKITDTTVYNKKTVHKGDTVFFANGFFIFNGFAREVKNPNYKSAANDIAVGADLDVYTLELKKYQAQPVYYIRSNFEGMVEDTVKDLSLYLRFSKINPEEETAELQFKQPAAKDDYIVMKAMVFPYINLLWIGTIIMVFGFAITIVKRRRAKN
jgi:cytochrome c-type biogenesis protein CcmF